MCSLRPWGDLDKDWETGLGGGVWPSVNINHLPIFPAQAKHTLSSPYPVHLLELWWWGLSARSCTGATKQLLNGSPVFRWHHLWLLQIRCKKWITAPKGWCNVSELCWATEWLWIHTGLSALLTLKLHYIQKRSCGFHISRKSSVIHLFFADCQEC